jgi:hypothetical protein
MFCVGETWQRHNSGHAPYTVVNGQRVKLDPKPLVSNSIVI